MLTNRELEALFEHASIGIVVMKKGGEIVTVNKYLLSRFGYDKEELVGKNIRLLIPELPEENESLEGNDQMTYPQHPYSDSGLELHGVTRNGKQFLVETTITYHSIDGSEFIAVYIKDVSRRYAIVRALKDFNTELDNKVNQRTASFKAAIRELEAQIKQVQAKDVELQKANSYLNTIWNHAGAIIIATDSHGSIELFNRTAEKLLGYTAEEVVHKHTPMLFHDAEEVQRTAKKLSEELGITIEPGFETFVARTRLDMSNQAEWTYIHKNGRRYPVDLAITALKNSGNEITGFLGIAFDISDRKKAETELKAALRKEKEVNELKSRFVSIASHEFRTPLSTILSSAYLIAQYKTMEEHEKRSRHVDRIVSSANMLTDILNDFLSIGKIEEGKIQVRTKIIDIEEYIASVLSELQGLKKKKQVIRYAHEGDETVNTDPSMLKHIIYNLVSNAMKFSPEDAIIEINTSNKNHWFNISVKDNGIGIPEEDQLYLFDLFYRGSNVTNIQGTGLGLHIIKRYTEILGGKIECVSRVNEGTRFRVSFKQ